MADRLLELAEFPPPAAGVPAPQIVANEHSVELSYAASPPQFSLGSSDRVFVQLTGVLSFTFGFPNDEALNGHPLYSSGLQPYSVFEVLESSWRARVAELNSVHPLHDPAHFIAYRHFIWTFHDSTFECLAREVRQMPTSVAKPSAPEEETEPDRIWIGRQGSAELTSLRLSLQRALLGEVQPSLRGVAIETREDPWTVHFYYDGRLEASKQDAASTIMTDVLADCALGDVVAEQVARFDAPEPLPDHPVWVYRRGE